MGASGLLFPPSTLLLRSSGRSAHRKVRFVIRRQRKLKVLALGGDDEPRPVGGSGDGSVDKGMSTLWRRIGELRGEEQQRGSGKELLPVELSRLEREEDSYMLYKSDMLEVLGLLQLHPEGERVKVDMGLTVMVKLTLPASVLVVMLHLMDAARVVLDGMKQKSS